MFIFGAVPDDMSFEFDPVSESSDEIEPQSEIGGIPWHGRRGRWRWRPGFNSGQTRRAINPRGPGKPPQTPKKVHDSYPFTISPAITWM